MLTPEDIAYITESFVPLQDEAVRAEIAAGRLPKPAYVLDDGTEMVAPDHLALAERAGGVGALRDWFEARAPGEWEAYISGEYAVCLRSVSPETIRRKDELITQIESLLAGDPPPLALLRAAVDELDALLRPFASYDRIRFGGPVSRDRYVTAVRERFPELATAQSTPERHTGANASTPVSSADTAQSRAAASGSTAYASTPVAASAASAGLAMSQSSQ
jgi:hypothetical protein